MERENDLAAYLFHEGTNYKAYEYLGSHKTEEGYVFRVWAPNAEKIFLCGDFNDWDESIPLEKITENGIWQANAPSDVISEGDKYKYKIYGNGQVHFKADPYANSMGLPPETASVIIPPSSYEWKDAGWLAYRKKHAEDFYDQPMNVYEIHAGSWKRREDGTPYDYTELAAELAPYVKQMGYTHVELMPITEYPFDGSWGYQVSSYFAPTARYGTPDMFRGFVDSMHEAGIGVILDWVPAHFPKDRFGLYEFDGKPLYEYQGWDRIENAGWGTRRFDVGRNEVQSFLISSASYWISEFHVDALRVDAVASMLYLDYDKNPGEWIPNIYGDNRCLESIAFFRKLNMHVKKAFPDALMIAEESTIWKNITSFECGGLGFDLKWNMGWMNDTLHYAELDPIYRKYHHGSFVGTVNYAFDEKFVLPISHDEVVHGKKSFLDKMPGDYWQKFANTRAFMGYMMTYPGKKLNFMGNEIGQFREWDYKGQLDWSLLEYDSHAKLQRYVAELNRLYLAHPELWEVEKYHDGFRWIDANDGNRSIVSYRRIAKNGSELLILINFTPVVYENFLLGTEVDGAYEEIFNSDNIRFGGSGVVNEGEMHTTGKCIGSYRNSIEIRVPPLAMSVFKIKS